MNAMLVSSRRLIAEPVSLSEVFPEAPSWLATMVGICLEKNKEHRFATFKELLEYMNNYESSNRNLLSRSVERLVSVLTKRNH